MILQRMLKIHRSKKKKQGKLEWFQDPSQINADNLNNAGTKSRHV
jgi:hypothetical protein